MTDAQFSSHIERLKFFGMLAGLGVVALLLAFLFLGDRPLTPLLVGVGIALMVPAFVWLMCLTIWHWKSRYRGTHSDIWGALLLIETSGWSKLIYLLRHVVPDARGRGRYRRPVGEQAT